MSTVFHICFLLENVQVSYICQWLRKVESLCGKLPYKEIILAINCHCFHGLINTSDTHSAKYPQHDKNSNLQGSTPYFSHSILLITTMLIACNNLTSDLEK